MEQDITCKKEKELFFSYLVSFLIKSATIQLKMIQKI